MNRAQRRRLRHVSHGGRRRYAAEIRENEDGTFDLIGVEILATGGPIHGVGSPPEGDVWTLDELRGMADAATALAGELDVPAKIGHADEQTMVENSIKVGELPMPEDGEMPAVGWVENQRLVGERLLGDVRKVPKIVKQLLELGAYRTRSVELSKVTSQNGGGKTYEWVVTGLAWLGGKMPAVRTLGDVVALYAGDVPVRRVFVDNREYDATSADIVWQPEAGFQDVVSDLQAALNPTGGSDSRYWVQDVSTDLTRCIVNDWTASATWIVPFTLDANGDPVPAPATDWTLAEQAWVAAATEYAEATAALRSLTVRDDRSDTGAMFTDEQKRKFAAATGLKVDAVTDKMLEDAGIAEEEATPDAEQQAAAEKAAAEKAAADEAARALAAQEPDSALMQRVKLLEEKNRSLSEENRLERRRAFVDATIRAAKIAPGQRKSLESLFDKGEDEARAFVDELTPRDDLLSELGTEDDDADERSLEERERSYTDDAASRLSLPKDSIV